jgi:hypothetical protein
MTDDQITQEAMRQLEWAVVSMANTLESVTGQRPTTLDIVLPASAAGTLVDLGGEQVGGIFCESGQTPNVTTWARLNVVLSGVRVLASTEHVSRPATGAEMLDLAEHGTDSRSRHRILS